MPCLRKVEDMCAMARGFASDGLRLTAELGTGVRGCGAMHSESSVIPVQLKFSSA